MGHQSPFLTLSQFIARGIIRLDEKGEYVGLADDGVEVSLGESRQQVEAYLVSHPTPSHW